MERANRDKAVAPKTKFKVFIRQKRNGLPGLIFSFMVNNILKDI
jgi:hypothetical protein